jgi:hypothetical protein
LLVWIAERLRYAAEARMRFVAVAANNSAQIISRHSRNEEQMFNVAGF